MLIQQLRSALTSKPEEDPNKALLKALITSQNKTIAEGGTSTLKPQVLSSLLNEGGNTMAEWLETLNKQEEGESDLSKLLQLGNGNQKWGKPGLVFWTKPQPTYSKNKSGHNRT